VIPAAPRPQRRHARSLWIGLASVLAALLLSVFVFGVVRVDGHSMEPTLHNGDRVLVLRTGAWLHRLGIGSYHAGDIVFFPDPTVRESALQRLLGGHLLIKRIVAGPDRQVALDDGRVVVDGRVLPERYLAGAFRGADSIPPMRVPARHDYVMGDNRHPLASFDSRSFGPVPAGTIEGRAVLVVWPLFRRTLRGWRWNVHAVTAPPRPARSDERPAAPSGAR